MSAPDDGAAKVLVRRLRAAAVGLGVTVMVPLAFAALPLDDDQGRVLVEAVESATALDLYNARCRGDNSGRYMDNLNKALVGRLRITVITIQDDFFPERSYRQAQQRMQVDFQETLKQAGGCKGAKESGLPNRMQAHHRELLEAIDTWP
jgi:hypothetical protein